MSHKQGMLNMMNENVQVHLAGWVSSYTCELRRPLSACRLLTVCGDCDSSDACIHAAHCSGTWHNINIRLHHHLLFGGLLISHEL